MAGGRRPLSWKEGFTAVTRRRSHLGEIHFARNGGLHNGFGESHAPTEIETLLLLQKGKKTKRERVFPITPNERTGRRVMRKKEKGT